MRLERELARRSEDERAGALLCIAGGEDPGERGNVRTPMSCTARLGDTDNVLSGECGAKRRTEQGWVSLKVENACEEGLEWEGHRRR